MLVSGKKLLLDAQKNGYAVGAFNVENMEMVQAIVEAAEEMHSPVILQTTPSTIKYAGVDYYYANALAAAKHASVPVVMHLDHGSSFELAVQAFRAGYTSIMIDGSKEMLEKNIALSKAVADVCHATDLRIAFTKGVKSLLAEAPDTFDPKKYCSRGKEEVKKYVMNRIELCGCSGKTIPL